MFAIVFLLLTVLLIVFAVQHRHATRRPAYQPVPVRRVSRRR
jgi:heme/copper-type cytochrome/quinol oxidase subunit 2